MSLSNATEIEAASARRAERRAAAAVAISWLALAALAVWRQLAS